ncbi:synaptic vesicle glycoprotein 2B-like [Epargyreus clarus]|uniref:synaptic vesicle glycoprotein 2B-like n=1 Tax=Epargyreus clarus TaxID=520877 RepID=UPI003C2FEE54
MSEVNLPALADEDEKKTTSAQEIDQALKECGFGWFHVQQLCTTLVAFVSGVLVTSMTPYVLPIAECDLNMGLVQKGMLNAVPYVGMLVSSIIAGFLTDTFGRKFFLVSGYGGIFIFTVGAGFSQTYEVLLITNLFSGMLFAAAFSATLTFTSEFCHSGIRDRVLLIQASFAASGHIVVALMTWGILIQDWTDSFFGGYIVLHTWNYYILLMSLWSLLACILYAFLPESPKYYITQNRYDEAREILIKIYKQNTGKPAETFPYINIWKEKVKQTIDETPELKATLGQQLSNSLRNIKPMFKRPLCLYLILLSNMMFSTMILYNIIRLWFPQLSTIVEHYGVDDQDLCMMLDKYTADLRQRMVNVTSSTICVPEKSGTLTYVNSIILGCVCLVPYLVTGIVVNKVGKKNLLLIASTSSIAATLGLRWSSSKVAMVGLFSLNASVTQTMMSLIQATTIELFPTTTRTLAVSVMMTCGRIGSMVGNVTFPILLDIKCVIPFFTLAGLMVCLTLMSMLLPKKKKHY